VVSITYIITAHVWQHGQYVSIEMNAASGTEGIGSKTSVFLHLFFAKSKTSKMDFALPKKSFAPQRPKVHKPDGKNMKNTYVLYVVFLGHFWPRLPRGFSVQYDTFVAEEGPKTRFMQLPLG